MVLLNYTLSKHRIKVKTLPEVPLLLKDQIFNIIELINVYRCPAVKILTKLPRLQKILLNNNTIIASEPETAISLPKKKRRLKKTKHGARAASY